MLHVVKLTLALKIMNLLCMKYVLISYNECKVWYIIHIYIWYVGAKNYDSVMSEICFGFI